MDIRLISREDALALILRRESHTWDHKSAKGGGAAVEKIAACFANADGGEFAVGIEPRAPRNGTSIDRWVGFASIEDGNFIQQALVNLVSPSVPYSIEWLEIEGEPERGLVALVGIYKSAQVHRTSKAEVWARHGAQCLERHGQAVVDLTLSKGTSSYEDQVLERFSRAELAAEPELAFLLNAISPRTDPDTFVRKQRLLDRQQENATVAAAVLFAEEPPTVIPKKCAVKVARYESADPVPSRDHLLGTPTTHEGPARQVISSTLAEVQSMLESLSIMEPDGTFAPARYPAEALKEIIVNAVIHRDYNISDDILISVFDNRVEVRSPGKLPGHITIDNILDERFSRNPTIVRLLNRFPNPPNKDIGEGLNTVFAKMLEAKLSKPRIVVDRDSVTVILGHTPVARPQEIVLEYLETHLEITNSVGRRLCNISSESVMHKVFTSLAAAGRLERVPGKAGNKAAWRLVESPRASPGEPTPADAAVEGQTSLF